MPMEPGKKPDRDSEVGGLRYEQVLLGIFFPDTDAQTDRRTCLLLRPRSALPAWPKNRPHDTTQLDNAQFDHFLHGLLGQSHIAPQATLRLITSHIGGGLVDLT